MENDKDCIEDSLDSDNEDFASFGQENTDHTLLTYSIYMEIYIAMHRLKRQTKHRLMRNNKYLNSL